MNQASNVTDHEAVGAWVHRAGEGYRAMRASAAVLLEPSTALYRIEGRHWQRFSQSMLTADFRSTTPGRVVAAAAVEANGSYLTHLLALIEPDGCLWALPQAVAAAAVETLRRYVLALDVRIEEARARTQLLTVQGPRAAELLSRAGWTEAGALASPLQAARRDDGDWIVRHTRTGELGFDLFVEAERTEATLAALLAAGAQAATAADLEVARIEAGLPLPPHDLDARVMPIEAPLRHAVSLSKGCYTGQEALAKMAHRGEPRRLLVGLDFGGADAPPPNTPLWMDGKRVGWTASAALSPTLGRAIALGWVKRALAEPGRLAHATDAPEAGVSATVAALPMVWGSGARFPVPEL